GGGALGSAGGGGGALGSAGGGGNGGAGAGVGGTGSAMAGTPGRTRVTAVAAATVAIANFLAALQLCRGESGFCMGRKYRVTAVTQV
ncbi:MAG: hypothetical protein JWP55_1982, partial [Mycobacterium sp.]|nr:hypothetical protein [Mycobacterium sp.]